MKLLPIFVLIVCYLFTTNYVNAEDQGHARKIRQKLSVFIPINSVEYIPDIGLYQVEVADGTVLFSNESGDHFISGSLYEIENNLPVNITERARNAERFRAASALNKDDLIIYPAQTQTTGLIYVFTDVDCVYCRRFHSEMEIYNSNGIEVRYIAWPRCGTNCYSYEKMVSVWCADDPLEAMTIAKSGAVPEKKECDNPVKQQYELGVKLGLQGTPFIILDDGTTIPGYKAASNIIAMLKKS